MGENSSYHSLECYTEKLEYLKRLQAMPEAVLYPKLLQRDDLYMMVTQVRVNLL